MLVYQKTMFDHYYCIKSFCHLKTLEKRFEKINFCTCITDYSPQRHEGFIVFKIPVTEQRLMLLNNVHFSGHYC